MTNPELILVITTMTTSGVIIIREIAAAFRRQKIEYRAETAHNDLVTTLSAADVKLEAIKVQTNGATTALQGALSDALTKIGRLEGMVQGIQTQRGVRSTDPVQPVPVIVVPPLPAIAAQATPEPLRVPLDEDDRRPR